jgi:hypothetical protein
MPCVVCSGELVERHFANAWERSRKLYACCSPGCAQRFDPDRHWLPAEAPVRADASEQQRLLRIAQGRLRAGDRPSVVVRELLTAGVGMVGIEKLVRDAELEAQAAARTVKRLGVLGAISGLFGRWRVTERRDRLDRELLRETSADLAAWRARFDPLARDA